MTTTENTLPLSPLTDAGLHDARKDAWDDLASWGCTLAACLDNPVIVEQAHDRLVEAAARRAYIYAALTARD